MSIIFFCLEKKELKKSRLFSFLNAKMKRADLNFSFDKYMMRYWNLINIVAKYV